MVHTSLSQPTISHRLNENNNSQYTTFLARIRVQKINMETIKLSLIFSLLFASCLFENVLAAGKVVCYYNHKAALRKDLARVTAEELKPALQMCTHLVYAYAGIDDSDYFIKSLDKDLDTEKGKNLFRAVTDLKRTYPGLAVLLSVGGFEDKLPSDTSHLTEKYLKILESDKKRGKFVSSAIQMMKTYGFDGLDLAWEFPFFKENKERSTAGSIWHSIKKAVTPTTKDEKEKEHREQFTLLVRELKYALRGEGNKLLTLTMMPHIKQDIYVDVPNVRDNVDQIHLMTLDFRTPERTDLEADYSAPLQYVYDRNQTQNIEAQVKWWSDKGVPPQKLIIAIPTYGKTWKLNEQSGKSGTPPLKAEGPGSDGTYTKTDGVLAYYEICPHIVPSTSTVNDPTALRKVVDSTGRLGTYAFRLPKDSKKGIWVSYDDPEVAARKAQYARFKGLGGVAIVDLSMDDFRGMCGADKFPILRAARVNVQ